MTKYDKDRSFTDFVHSNLAIPQIYNELGWNILNIDKKELKHLDLHSGIDYVLINEQGQKITVQERFRDEFYKSYNDATLRFRREFNSTPERVKSEFYKIKADYLIYGITNGKKFPDKRATLTNFIKWVALDLKYIQEKHKTGKIKIIPQSSQIKCWVKDGILHCPENFNRDNSSSFLPFDIKLIKSLWGEEPILKQKGYY